MFSLEKEHAGQKHAEGGEKLNQAIAHRAAVIRLELLLGFSFLQKALRINHVLLYTAPGLYLLNECRVSDLLNADGVIILITSTLKSGGAATLIFQNASPIHTLTHEGLIRQSPWRKLVDIITAIVFFICGAGTITAVHVVVVVGLLFRVAETEMWTREAP